MWNLLYAGFRWSIHHINRFEGEHWVVAFCVLLTLGFLCMQGLGVRGK